MSMSSYPECIKMRGIWAIINLNLLSHIKFYATQWKETKAHFLRIKIYFKQQMKKNEQILVTKQ